MAALHPVSPTCRLGDARRGRTGGIHNPVSSGVRTGHARPSDRTLTKEGGVRSHTLTHTQRKELT